MTSPAARSIVLLGILLVCASRVRGQQQAPILFVDDRPMLKATLKAGEKVYYCHLLLDLSLAEPLVLHRNAAGSLRAQETDISFEGLKLEGVPITPTRSEWLETLTRDYAKELQEVPCAGFIGLSAFGSSVVQIDGPGKVLRTFDVDPTAGADAAPPPNFTRVAFLAGSDATSVSIQASVGDSKVAKLLFDTKERASTIERSWFGAADTRPTVPSMMAGTLDLARLTPFRRVDASPLDGTVGATLISKLVVTIDRTARQLALQGPASAAYPKDEADFYAALDAPGHERLREFYKANPSSRWTSDAAGEAFTRATAAAPRDLDVAIEAALAVVDATSIEKKATTALALDDALAKCADSDSVRQRLLSAGAAVARGDADGTAQLQVRMRLGQIELSRGNHKEAYRNLLSAAFGMTGDGRPALSLGHLHRDLGQLDRAWSRYVQALLDVKQTGVDGLIALDALWRKQHQGGGGLAAAIAESVEGKAPGFHPIPRDAAETRPAGGPVLVELFTGAHCPPCTGADLAVDALEEYFTPDREVITLVWHLPIPAPEPLVSTEALARARHYSVEGTPTIVVQGGEKSVGGGGAGEAPKLFEKFKSAVEEALADAKPIDLDATVAWSGDKLTVTPRLAPIAGARLHAILTERSMVFPGRNGVIFHHAVVRAALTSPDGADASVNVPALDLTMATVESRLDRQLTQFEAKGPFPIRPTQPDPTNLAVVLFVEKPGDGVVAAKRIDVPAPAEGKGR